ncbi:hypothetical protein NL676_026986 [Syzygium grande]|nr:hypothetical protein NL676_026986 [Syzygium grande]
MGMPALTMRIPTRTESLSNNLQWNYAALLYEIAPFNSFLEERSAVQLTSVQPWRWGFQAAGLMSKGLADFISALARVGLQT